MHLLYSFVYVLVCSTSLCAMDSDPSYAVRSFKVHKGTMKALKASNVVRVASVLEQEKNALEALYFRAVAQEKLNHAADIHAALRMNIDQRAAALAKADAVYDQREQLHRSYHIDRMKKYCARELPTYKRIINSLEPVQEQSSWLPETKTITISLTGATGLLSQYTSDPFVKVACVALALVSGYVTVNKAEKTSVEEPVRDQWQQQKSKVLDFVQEFEKSITDELKDWQKGIRSSTLSVDE